MYIVNKNFCRVKKIYDYLAQRLFFNIMIRLILESYMEFSVDSFLNLKQVRIFLDIII
jgi:hypothetical protein